MTSFDVLRDFLDRRLDATQGAWLSAACAELRSGVSDDRFCQLSSLASRYSPRAALAPTRAECDAAERALPGWSPERWRVLEAVRCTLVLAHPGVADQRIESALGEAFRYADIGECCALYKSLAHLPDPQRFVWQAGEGARSSMRDIFESACCDTPYPLRWFDASAWRQMVVKCMFIEAPMWRVWGLDTRLDAELARMALDLVEERRSAGRPIRPELWMLLGSEVDARGLAQLERELREGEPRGRAGAGLGLVRAGQRDRVLAALADEADPMVQDVLGRALAGASSSRAWAALDPDIASYAGVR